LGGEVSSPDVKRSYWSLKFKAGWPVEKKLICHVTAEESVELFFAVFLFYRQREKGAVK
jgi:hypothetical protein